MNQPSVPPLQLITFQEFSQMSFQLAGKIQEAQAQDPFDIIISINRGGAVLARILSDYLGAEIAAFGMVSYTGINDQKEIRINQDLNADLADKNVLLVDEICDTGKTFIKAVEIAELLKPRTIKTATLITKPHSVFKPDFSIALSDKWVVFPYEVRETIKSLWPLYTSNRDLKQKLEHYFLTIGISTTDLHRIEEGLQLS
jgi:hypoxanthine phosphoribosyltransferase